MAPFKTTVLHKQKKAGEKSNTRSQSTNKNDKTRAPERAKNSAT